MVGTCTRAAAAGLALTAAVPSRAWGHEDAPLAPHDLWRAWTLEPLVLLGITAAALVYFHGVRQVWRRAGAGRGVRRWQAACFAGGLGILAVALISPLHALGGVLFGAHMTQHVLLMGIAAPLLVLGEPLRAAAWALPPQSRRRAADLLAATGLRAMWRGITTPAAAWVLHALVLWAWHAPRLYSATVGSDAIHTAQHTSFILAAVVFWAALRDRATHGLGVLYLFTTAVHSSILGALLAFAPVAYYTPYEATAPLWGMSALEDQQIGGLIMWVPAGLVYFGAALALLASWLRRAEHRSGLRPWHGTGQSVAQRI